MTLKQLLDQISNEIVYRYVEKMLFYARKIEDDNELLEKYIELSCDFLEELMSLVFKYLYDEYQISPKKLTEEEIEDLFYTKDGKTFKERIKEYVKERDDKRKFIYHIYRFLSTESIHSVNKISFLKLREDFLYCKVNDLYCCEGCMDKCLYLERWTPCEKVDLDDLPPYHPDCQCVVIFSNDKEE